MENVKTDISCCQTTEIGEVEQWGQWKLESLFASETVEEMGVVRRNAVVYGQAQTKMRGGCIGQDFGAKGRQRRKDCDVLCIRAAGQEAVAVKTEVGGNTVRETAVLKTAVVETATVETAAAETEAVETGAMETAAVETATVDTAAVETAVVDTAAVETATEDTAAVKTAGVETPTSETAGVDIAAVETAVAADE
ncbi:hypothetical protein CBR_g32346 [Chara braunii]|uniref:Uncharacterized protein n=1 Tax=Chara braunii TaxID=69332 RepID=A0A388JNH0_CHABU|nr:hypothetical protein CBR_g32346 [Chara braunii]|eukprot:GBG59334.1 hypothetical protein CBR_g32346 [Chara braunii]